MPRHAKRRLTRAGGHPRPRRVIRWGRLLLILVCAGAVVTTAACADVFYRAMATVPSLSDPTHTMTATSVIYDRNGKVVTNVPSVNNRQPVDISTVPKLLQDAFVATEDKTFYQNPGISVRGIARAALVDITAHQTLQGGSTISQEVARMLYLSREDTLTRKLREAAIAIELNRRYTKTEILGMYLNDIYLGEHSNGVEAAAQAYFDQSDLSKLTLPQMALLAGLPQAPSSYDPFVNPDAATHRRNQVLTYMGDQGYITAAQEAAAQAAPLGLARGTVTNGAAETPYPWFVDSVVQALERDPYDLTAEQITDGGLKIYTTLDPKVQDAADAAVAAHIADLPAGIQTAEVVMDQYTGDVVAIVGGRSYETGMGLNRAIDVNRQPGSSIKPIAVYIPALENGLTAGTVVDDVVHDHSTSQQAWLPQDDQLPYYGMTTLTEALRRSVNTVAIEVLNHIGVETGFDNAVQMGLPLSPDDKYLPLAIGGISQETCCSPLNMATAYSAIANGGMRVTPRLVTKVIDGDGKTIITDAPDLKRVVDPRIAFVMTKMLETVTNPQANTGWDVLSGPDDSNWGTGFDASIDDRVPGWPTAGKTGTTENNHDAWFVGFTPAYTAAVWIGYDDNRPVQGLYGGTYAGPIFRDTLAAALKGQTPKDFAEPPGVVQAKIDIRAPQWQVAKPSPLTPPADIRTEWFVAGTQPTSVSTSWVQVQVDSTHPDELWQPGCAGSPVTKVFFDRKPLLGQSWAAPIAAADGTSNWQQFIPLDMSLVAPSATCTPGAGINPGNGGPGGTGPGGAPQNCIENWTIKLSKGQSMNPISACILTGQPAQLSFVSTDGQTHDVIIEGLGQEASVPANGTPVTITFTPSAEASYIMEDQDDPTEVGRLTVEPAPTSSTSSSGTADASSGSSSGAPVLGLSTSGRPGKR